MDSRNTSVVYSISCSPAFFNAFWPTTTVILLKTYCCAWAQICFRSTLRPKHFLEKQARQQQEVNPPPALKIVMWRQTFNNRDSLIEMSIFSLKTRNIQETNCASHDSPCLFKTAFRSAFAAGSSLCRSSLCFRRAPPDGYQLYRPAFSNGRARPPSG